ncbi:MAG: aspartyl protease family protein, partial [Candidatus Thorarchaeota archaeon]
MNMYSNHISVPVTVNGLGPMMFTIDTGATVTSISNELASMLGINSFYDFEDKWSVIQLPYTIGNLDRFEIGSEIILNEEVIVLDISSILKVPKGAMIGNIGHSTLERYTATFDYPNSLFELHNVSNDDQALAPFTYVDNTHLVGVPTYINGNGPFNFVIDTGSGGTVISLDLAEHLGLNLIQASALCRGVGGDAQGYFTNIESIMVGGAEMKSSNVMALDFGDISPRGKTIRNGIIGAPFLRNFKLTIDYPNQTFSFTN